jgi:hypothetical protein
MLTRSIMFSLLAAATVAATAVVTSSAAEARPNHGGGVSSHGRGVGPAAHRLSVRPAVHRGVRVNLHRGFRVQPRLTILRPGCWHRPWLCRPIVRPHFCWRHPLLCNRPYPVVMRYPIVRPYPVVAAAPVAPVASACTCLRKTYLPNGAVLFRDVCTNESAVNPPARAADASQAQ